MATSVRSDNAMGLTQEFELRLPHAMVERSAVQEQDWTSGPPLDVGQPSLSDENRPDLR